MLRTSLRTNAKWIALLSAMAFAAPTAGETFELRSGGSITGNWSNRGEQGAKVYRIQTDSGIRVVIRRAEVRSVRSDDPSHRMYAKLAADFPDTADGQRRLAEWCRGHGLKQQRQRALERVLELAPDDEAARKALGYHWMRGKWVRPADLKRGQGLIRKNGRWQFPQEVELAERHEAKNRKALEWRETVFQLRAKLGTPEQEAAAAELLKIRDPLAIPGLLDLLGREPVVRLRRTYTEIIAGISSGASVEALKIIAMEARDPDTFDTAARLLAARGVDSSVTKHFVKLLRSNHNGIVNRAAAVLAELGDESAVGPLIDALVTRHWSLVPGEPLKTIKEPVRKINLNSEIPEFVMQETLQNPDAIRWEIRRNQEVLNALSVLTDQGFGFRQQQWRNWHHALLNLRTQQRLRNN